mgnify:CR=1 FL=1
MPKTSITIFNSSIAGAASGPAKEWEGGRASLVISADQYGSIFLQSQGANGSWINLNASTYSADQVTAYDIPRGQVRLNSVSGSSVNVSATLTPISYGG